MKPMLGAPVLFTGKHWFVKQNHSAAYIAAVNSDSSVNLTVSNESGSTYGVQNVRFVTNPNDIVAGENYCQPNTGDAPFTADDADKVSEEPTSTEAAPQGIPADGSTYAVDQVAAPIDAPSGSSQQQPTEDLGNAPATAGTSEQPEATPSFPASSDEEHTA